MDPARRMIVMGPDYCSEARRLFSAMTVPPSELRRRRYDRFYRALKLGGAYPYLRYMLVLVARQAQWTHINLINPTQVATDSGTPLFASDVGCFGDGAGVYTTGLTVTAMGLGQDDAAMGAWMGGAVQSTVATQYACGVSTLGIEPWSSTGTFNARNGATTGDTTTAPQTAGLYSTSRNNSANYEMRHKGVSLVTKTRTSATPSAGNVSVGSLAGLSTRAAEPIKLFYAAVATPVAADLVIQNAFTDFLVGLSGD